MTTNNKSIEELQAELDEIILWFESESATVDESLKKFEMAQQIIKELKNRLKAAELTVNKVTTSEQ